MGRAEFFLHLLLLSCLQLKTIHVPKGLILGLRILTPIRCLGNKPSPLLTSTYPDRRSRVWALWSALLATDHSLCRGNWGFAGGASLLPYFKCFMIFSGMVGTPGSVCPMSQLQKSSFYPRSWLRIWYDCQVFSFHFTFLFFPVSLVLRIWCPDQQHWNMLEMQILGPHSKLLNCNFKLEYSNLSDRPSGGSGACRSLLSSITSLWFYRAR